MSDQNQNSVAPKPDYQKPVVQPAQPQPAAFPPRAALPARDVPWTAPAPAVATSLVTADIERLLATGDKLLKNQQERIVNEEAQFETTRTQIMNDYNAKAAKLDHDTKEALFQLATNHEQTLAGIKRLIAKLNAMREA